MAAFLDACRFVPTLGGTTDWIYSAAVTGYQSPTAALAVNGAIYRYRAESSNLAQWEIGYGAYNSGTGVFARTTVLFNSSGTTVKINFTVAPQVAIVPLAEDFKISPTIQILSGSGTYTTPTNALWIRVRGGGGGGAGGSSGGSPTAATAGGATTFGTSLLTASGGALGSSSSAGSAGGLGGTASGGNIANLQGGSGGNGNTGLILGGSGGNSPFFGGSGTGGIAGLLSPLAAQANTGGGGGGAGSGGGGGGAGGCFESIIASPLATYAYAVGAGGVAGTGGTTQAGLAGAAGQIIVEEFYN